MSILMSLTLASLGGAVIGGPLHRLAAALPGALEARWRHDSLELLGATTEVPPGDALTWPWALRTATGAGAPGPRWATHAARGLAITAALGCVLGGYTGVTLAIALGLSWWLLLLADIDRQSQLLPDMLTLPLIWAGLLFSSVGGFITARDAVLGACAGYMVLRIPFEGFRMMTGREGFGFGDFKMLAALGAWFGWQALPAIVLLATAIGAAAGMIAIAAFGRARNSEAAFGPFLALAGWLYLVAGHGIDGLLYAGGRLG